jgi:catechol 2,3-dioxygenase-like lactoylglutathione lyase family enzyme
MLESEPIMAFLATTDAERAKAFFRDVLGLTFVTDDSFALVFDAGGTMLRVSRVASLSPPPYTVLGWKVADIEKQVDDLQARGVEFLRIQGFGQDSRGICTFPGGARVAWFKDPDGHTLSLTQFSP